MAAAPGLAGAAAGMGTSGRVDARLMRPIVAHFLYDAVLITIAVLGS